MKKSFKVIFIAMFVLMLPQHASSCDWFWKCVTRIKFCQIFNVGLCCPILIPCCSSIFVPLMNETEIEPLLRQSSTMDVQDHHDRNIQYFRDLIAMEALERQEQNLSQCMVGLALRYAKVSSAATLLQRGIRAHDPEYCLKQLFAIEKANFSTTTSAGTASEKLLTHFTELGLPDDEIIKSALEHHCFAFFEQLMKCKSLSLTDPDELLIAMGKSGNKFVDGYLCRFAQYIAQAVCDSKKNYDVKKMLIRATMYGLCGSAAQFLLNGIEIDDIHLVLQKVCVKKDWDMLFCLCTYGGYFMPYRKAEVEFDTELGVMGTRYEYYVDYKNLRYDVGTLSTAECGSYYFDNFKQALAIAFQKYSQDNACYHLSMLFRYALRHKHGNYARDIIALLVQQKADTKFIADFLCLYKNNFEYMHTCAGLCYEPEYTEWLKLLEKKSSNNALARELCIRLGYHRNFLSMLKKSHMTDVHFT